MLTVVMATFNGERTLPTVLSAYEALFEPAGGWNLVVVDNDSSDGTPDVLSRFSSVLPMTVLKCCARGKNRALNFGLQAVKGDLVVFTDDDAVPRRNWLQELRHAADHQVEFDLFGGTILPRWERTPEQWHLHWVQQGPVYTLTDPNQPEGPMPARNAWGPNMAVRARVFEAGHRFEESIGPMAGVSYRMGSETEFTRRMESAGFRAWFVPAAIVEHMIRSFQMERQWVLARATRYGKGLCYRNADELLSGARFQVLPRHQWRKIAETAVQLMIAKLFRRQEQAFHHSWTLRCKWGYFTELRRMRAASRGV
jgi:glycosyltransferase involved in cell wall biosynthesis